MDAALTEAVKFELWLGLVQKELECRGLAAEEMREISDGKVVVFELGGGVSFWLPRMAGIAEIVDGVIDVKHSMKEGGYL